MWLSDFLYPCNQPLAKTPAIKVANCPFSSLANQPLTLTLTLSPEVSPPLSHPLLFATLVHLFANFFNREFNYTLLFYSTGFYRISLAQLSIA